MIEAFLLVYLLFFLFKGEANKVPFYFFQLIMLKMVTVDGGVYFISSVKHLMDIFKTVDVFKNICLAF